jgi:hypothetical protein
LGAIFLEIIGTEKPGRSMGCLELRPLSRPMMSLLEKCAEILGSNQLQNSDQRWLMA